MTVARYTPDFSQERHSSYKKALDSKNYNRYYKHINRFILDKNLSAKNQEDIELFKDLLFESKFGRIHINYSEWLVKYAKKKKSRIALIDRYIEYISEVSSLFYGDFVSSLVKSGNDYIEYLVSFGALQTRLVLVKTLAYHFPKMMQDIPKLKTYLLFS